jgi:type IV pilus assembly protein PilY1
VWVPLALLVASLIPGASPAVAQPDIREIRPAVMLLIDSSGSMEYVGNCECTTLTCRECMTNCASATPQRNRWANVLEVLTGEWTSYSCTTDPNRRGTGPSGTSYSGQYDQDYYLAHTVHPYGTTQADNGILDTYVDRVKFGLMTFDAHPTYIPYGALIPNSSFNETLSNGVEGSYSYAGSRGFRYYGCPDNNDRRVNSGARSETATAGRLVSVGFESATVGVPSDDHTVINAAIQSTLTTPGLRPFGATPVAAMFEDLEHYFQNHPDVRPSNGITGDPYRECRQRFAILLTDGRPNMDFRGHPYYCEHYGGTESGGSVSGGVDRCPYDTPENSAARLTSASGPLDGMYVIGMNIRNDDAAARTTLNAIATAGETCPAGGGDCARFPASASDLRVDFEEILRQTAPGTTTRTVPAFSAASVGGGSQAQLQTGFNPSFSVVSLGYEPWQGVLERRRFLCDGLSPVAQPIDSTDRFHELLNTQGTRTLLTTAPAAGSINGHLIGSEGASLPAGLTPPPLGNTPVSITSTPAAFNSVTVTPAHLGLTVSDNAGRDAVLAWVRGDAGTPRADKRMGSIYHSSPIVVGPPGADRSDETFNEYRQLIGDRPRVLYVGTNDGILHAFLADDYSRTVGATTSTYTGGTELWGYIPPILLDELEDTMTSHQWMLDGTPVVQEVITARTDVGSAAEWRTVLVMGFRQGARGYFALDVTDPFEPKFLWQYTNPHMGQTYGQPRMAQVNVQFPSGGLHQRTVALLPGGYDGAPLAGTSTPSDPRHIPDTANGISPRPSRRNWGAVGRSLFVVDVLTGKLIREFDDFPAPLTGGVSVFPGSVGSDAQAAYFNDHDGILWRLDLSASDPDDWDYQAIWDMAHGLGATEGQPAYVAPLLSTVEDGRVVIIQASGNVDLLEDGTAVNRVVSLTETINVNPTTFAFTGVDMTVNWDILNGASNALDALRPGEQVTGPLELFNGVVYFGSFTTDVQANNACSFGYSRLWAVDYIENDGDIHTPVGRLPATTSGGPERVAYDSTTPGYANLQNGLLMGVSIAARPRCTASSEVSETDPYVGSAQQRYHVTDASAPQFELVAQISGQGSGGPDGGAVATIGLSLTTPPIQVQTVGSVRRVE